MHSQSSTNIMQKWKNVFQINICSSNDENLLQVFLCVCVESFNQIHSNVVKSTVEIQQHAL